MRTAAAAGLSKVFPAASRSYLTGKPMTKAQLVSALRAQTNCSITQALAAITAAPSSAPGTLPSLESTLSLLTQSMSADASRKAAKASTRGVGSQGLVTSAVLHSGWPVAKGVPAQQRARAGVLELRCETDFVGRTDVFRQLAGDVAYSLAFLHEAAGAGGFADVKDVEALKQAPLLSSDPAAKPGDAPERSIQESLQAAIGRLGENIVLHRFSGFSLPPPTSSASSPITILGQYTHGAASSPSPSPSQSGTVTSLISLTVPASFQDETAALELARKLARQATGFPTTSVAGADEGALLGQPMLGGQDGESVREFVARWARKHGIAEEEVVVGDLRRWALGEEAEA